MKRTIVVCVAAGLGVVLTGGFNDPGGRGDTTQLLTGALAPRDIFFYFRERLPDDPFYYEEPESLYASVREPFTRYYPYETAQRIVTLFSSARVDLGIWPDSAQSGVLVRQVFDGSAGDAAGLLPDDTITHVGTVPCAGLSLDSTADLLSGTAGETLVLRVRRATGEGTLDAVLVEYLAPTVVVDSVDTAVAYLWLMEFTDETNDAGGSAGEFHKALERTAWAEYTILDLRDNGGGLVSQCLEICGEFVPAGTAVVKASERQLDSSGSGPQRSYFGTTVDTVWATTKAGIAQQRRLYVLVNEWTASASEILVSCLRDYRSEDVTIVGATTYGKGRGQYFFGYNFDTEEFYLIDRGMARVTFTVLEPVYGAPYDSIGIVPDVVAGDGESALSVAMARIDQQRGGAITKSRAVAGRVTAIERSRGELSRDEWEPLCVDDR